MRMTIRQRFLSVALAFASVACVSAPAFARQAAQANTDVEEGIPTRWATDIRGGVGIGATSGVVGFGWRSPAMGPNKYLRLDPTIFGAFASGSFSFGINFDVLLSAKIPSSDWSLLVGGGVSVLATHTSNGGCLGCGGGSSLTVEIRAVAGENHGTEVLAGWFLKKGK